MLSDEQLQVIRCVAATPASPFGAHAEATQASQLQNPCLHHVCYPSRVNNPAKPLMLFDGDCSFCRRWIVRWQYFAREKIDFEPFQSQAERFPEIPLEDFKRAIHLIEPDGAISSGAAAVFRMFALCNYRPWLLWLYEQLPGFAMVAETFYQLVANHRNGFDKLDMRLIGKTTDPPTHQFTRDIFLRLLGAVYLIAFVSLWVQIPGLIGSRGILSIANYLDAIRHAYPGAERFWSFPTLCWLRSSDGFLQFLCSAGAVMSVMLIAGIAPVLMLVGLWTCYLSLVVAGQDFLQFQWDSLL